MPVIPPDPDPGGSVLHDALTVSELLGQESMRGARLIAGAGGLGRLIRRLNVMTVPNIVGWTKQEEFLLTTGYPLPRDASGFCRLVQELAANGLAGLGVKLDEYLAGMLLLKIICEVGEQRARLAGAESRDRPPGLQYA